MQTSEMLKQMPTKNRQYLESLKVNINDARMNRQFDLADEFKAMGRGYIRAMVDCGIIPDFKTAWCWFIL